MPKRLTRGAHTPDALYQDALYQQYVKPLEQAHDGEYVLITPDGGTVLSQTLLGVAQKAAESPSSQNVIFRVGAKSVGKIR
jgi:hypothetical protein